MQDVPFYAIFEWPFSRRLVRRIEIIQLDFRERRFDTKLLGFFIGGELLQYSFAQTLEWLVLLQVFCIMPVERG
jgi:hypothetical protein